MGRGLKLGVARFKERSNNVYCIMGFQEAKTVAKCKRNVKLKNTWSNSESCRERGMV